MSGPQPTRPQRVKATERRLFVLSLRASGAKYRDIAKQTIVHFGGDHLPKGYDHAYACHDVQIELKRIARETRTYAETLHAQELDRLDRMLTAIWAVVLKGNFGAIDRALRIAERRAKLLGIDAPVKIAPTNPEGTDEYSFGASLEERAKRLWELAQEIGPAGGGSEESLDPAEGAADTGVH